MTLWICTGSFGHHFNDTFSKIRVWVAIQVEKKNQQNHLSFFYLLDVTQGMPSLLWTGLQKVCLDQICFMLNMIWDFTSPLRELQGIVCTELLSLNIRCVLTWLCPRAWLSSMQGAETGGHWGLPNTVWEELEKKLYTSAFVFMLYLPLTVMFCSRTRGAVGKTIQLIEFC